MIFAPAGNLMCQSKPAGVPLLIQEKNLQKQLSYSILNIKSSQVQKPNDMLADKGCFASQYGSYLKLCDPAKS
jgi:hypothetical protein